MMKHKKIGLLAAVLMVWGMMSLTSCSGTEKKQVPHNATEKSEGVPVKLSFTDEVSRYMSDSIGSRYAAGEVCIPSVAVVANVERNDSVEVWGDFWVFNYNVEGDTLKMVSGGSHPGLLQFVKTKGGYKVVSFDQVEDGAGNLASAKRIFGDMYEAFHGINGNEKVREQVRAAQIADYVKAHNLPVKYYQDSGWPAKEIPVR